jgi:hypothetical protein
LKIPVATLLPTEKLAVTIPLTTRIFLAATTLASRKISVATLLLIGKS